MISDASMIIIITIAKKEPDYLLILTPIPYLAQSFIQKKGKKENVFYLEWVDIRIYIIFR